MEIYGEANKWKSKGNGSDIHSPQKNKKNKKLNDKAAIASNDLAPYFTKFSLFEVHQPPLRGREDTGTPVPPTRTQQGLVCKSHGEKGAAWRRSVPILLVLF